MRQHFSCYTKIVLRVAFSHSAGARAIRGKQKGAGRQHVQVLAQETNPHSPSGSTEFQGGSAEVTWLGCSLFPGCPETGDLLSVCWECFIYFLWLQNTAGEQQSSCQDIVLRKGPQTSNSRPGFVLSYPTHQILQEHFSPDTDLSLLGQEILLATAKKRINEPPAHKCTQGEEFKLGLHLTHLTHIKLGDDTCDNQVCVLLV